ncbi:MAG: inorganic phosphate transporter [Zestosphaera sp.]
MLETNVILLTCSLAAAVFLAWSAGSNNAANIVAAVVGARTIKLNKALLITSVFVVLGSLMLGSSVAWVLSAGIVDVGSVPTSSLIVGMLVAMLAAGSWVLTASLLKVPVSVNETVLAGIIGFGILVDLSSVMWGQVIIIYVLRFSTVPLSGLISFLIKKFLADYLEDPETTSSATLLSLFLISAFTTYLTVSKLLGVVLGLLTALVLSTSLLVVSKVYVDEKSIDRYERIYLYRNVFSVLIIALMSLAYGASNAGITAGPLLKIVTSELRLANESALPALLAFSGLLISLGIISWGRRVVGTLGEELATLNYSTAVVTYFSASLTTLVLAELGVPAATTMAVTGSIIGASLAEGYSAVNMRVVRKILTMWALTTPACVTISCVLYWLIMLVT